MNQAYTALSKIYERLVADSLYEKWAGHVVDVLNANAQGKTGFDLACGSGYFTRAVKRAGYDVTGVDISAEMLTQAQTLVAKESLKIPFLKQDMTALKSFDKVDFLTIINDGVNYVAPDKLKKAFSTFYGRLKPQGVLFFDFSTEYKLREIIGDNMFAEDYDDMTYLWFNRLIGGHIEMDITVFTKKGDLYEKRDESHTQYIHTLDFMVSALNGAGFSKVTASGFLGEEITPHTERIEILAVR